MRQIIEPEERASITMTVCINNMMNNEKKDVPSWPFEVALSGCGVFRARTKERPSWQPLVSSPVITTLCLFLLLLN